MNGREHDHREGAPPAAAAVRVILVGRQAGPVSADSLESRLRRDAGIELIRARDPLDAIGELTLANGDTRAAVVALPGALGERDEDDFRQAVLRANPNARVFGLNGDSGQVERLTPDSLRAALREKPTADSGAAPTPARAAAAPSGKGVGAGEEDERQILRALLTGSDIREACCAVLRKRLRDPSVTFAPSGAGAQEPGAGRAERRETPVEHRGVAMGTLRTSAKVTALEAARAAEWLALWLSIHEQHAQLRQAAFTDPLTGVWNRRYFDRFLPSAIERARAARHELSLLIFDVDNFKQFNDRHGHAAGDEILMETVRLLKSVVRPADRVCRIGGDEFAVVFYEPEGPREASSRHPASLSEIAARFQAQVFQQRFPKLGAHAPGILTISGGMATFPWDANDAPSLMARADALAMESKELGKNTIKFGVGRPVGGAGPLNTPGA